MVDGSEDPFWASRAARETPEIAGRYAALDRAPAAVLRLSDEQPTFAPRVETYPALITATLFGGGYP